MKVQAKIQKWGNGLAIRIAGVMRDIPNFKEGMLIEVEVSEDGLEIKKIKSMSKLKLPFSETDLLADMTPDIAHVDMLAKLQHGEY